MSWMFYKPTFSYFIIRMRCCIFLLYFWVTNVVFLWLELVPLRKFKSLWENENVYLSTNMWASACWRMTASANRYSDVSHACATGLCMCKAESAGRDILTAGGQIQLLCFSLVATAPTSGGPRPPQRSCPNPVHLQRVVVLGVVWCGVMGGGGGASCRVWRCSRVWCTAEECVAQSACFTCAAPLRL